MTTQDLARKIKREYNLKIRTEALEKKNMSLRNENRVLKEQVQMLKGQLRKATK